MRNQGFGRNFPSPVNYVIPQLTIMIRETDNGLQLADKETDPEVTRFVLGHSGRTGIGTQIPDSSILALPTPLLMPFQILALSHLIAWRLSSSSGT